MFITINLLLVKSFNKRFQSVLSITLVPSAQAESGSGYYYPCCMYYDEPAWFVDDYWDLYCPTCSMKRGHNFKDFNHVCYY